MMPQDTMLSARRKANGMLLFPLGSYSLGRRIVEGINTRPRDLYFFG